MNKIELLVRALILLMSEYKVKNHMESTKLAEQVININNIQSKKVRTFGDEENIVDKLTRLMESIINGDVLPNDDIMMSLEIILSEKQSLLKIIDKYVIKKNPEASIKLLKKELQRELKRHSTRNLLAFSLAKLSKPNTDINTILENLIMEVGKIKEAKGYKDIAIVDEINFESKESVIRAAGKAKALISGSQAYKTGWDCINKMTQGGIRLGEFVTVSALKHNYKSSLVKSLFLQIMRLNTPIIRDKNKKPLLVFISIEEEVDNIMFFLYAYLKFSLERISIKPTDKNKIDQNEMSEYVMAKMTEKGFNARVYRFVPDLLTYEKLFSFIERLEHEGYDVQGVFLDYAKKMSKDGCVKTGPQGTDLLDLFSKLRNYFSAKGTFFVTPHQLNTQANQLIKTGLPPQEFISHIVDKNYYADSAQLGQEIDLELFLHKGKMNKTPHLFIGRGKHRIPTVIPEEDQLAILKFVDEYAPIPEDNENETPCIKACTTNDEFDF